MSAPDRRSRFPASRPLSGGRSGGDGLAITEQHAALVQITARKGRHNDVTATIGRVLALDLPPPGRTTSGSGRTAVWIQPGSWLIRAPGDQKGQLASNLRQSLDGMAAVVDQSHGRSVIELSGKHAEAVLARLCRLDLHERAFAAGSSASTLVGHVSCQLISLGGPVPSFGLIVGSTLAEWLLDELQAAAASYGWTFQPAPDVAA